MRSEIDRASVKLTEEQQKLVADNEYIIGRVLKELHRRKHYDDLYGVAAVGLCEAAKNYDKNRGVPFYPVAFSYIKWKIFAEDKKRKKDLNPTLSLNQMIEQCDDELGSIISAPDEWESLEYKILVESIYQKVEPALTVEEKGVFRLWLHGERNSEIARAMGAKRATISWKIVHARNKCQALFNADEIFA